ncbi:hypothetical protein BH18ACT2_BH18ACT2_23410 [soil metagenome]
MARADNELTNATEVAASANRHLRDLERRAADRTAEAAAAERTLGALDRELEGVGDVEALQVELAMADQLRESATGAQRDLEAAEASALAHRTAAEHVRTLAEAADATADASRLRVLEEAQGVRAATLRAELASIPGDTELRSSIELAELLGARQRSAIDQLHAAEQVHRSAVAERDQVATAAGAATDELYAARDRLAPLRPPPLAGERVANEWAVLLAWASERQLEQRDAMARLGAEHSATTIRRAAIDIEARQEVVAVLGAADGTIDDLRDRLTRGEEFAGREVEAFDARRARTTVLRRRVETLHRDREVADELGRLLRADGFEAWLMEAALDELAAVASARLRELSSGQFSLEVVDRELVVRDHANADELRSARTLSGGETFLASLALSLALADATTELSSEGAPQIESIFLDEGFGTLDPDTLDVVATTIEELGSAGRMVAVVTHLRELADRMPVRLEVARDASGARVNRVDV